MSDKTDDLLDAVLAVLDADPADAAGVVFHQIVAKIIRPASVPHVVQHDVQERVQAGSRTVGARSVHSAP